MFSGAQQVQRLPVHISDDVANGKVDFACRRFAVYPVASARSGLTKEVLPLYLILLLATLFLVAMGMLVSTLNQSADGALRYTYLFTFLLAFATLIPWFFLQGKAGIWPQVASWLRYVSPVNAVTQLLGHGDLGSQGVMQQQRGPWTFVLIACVGSALLIGLNIFILSRRIFDISRSAGKVTDDRSLAVRTGRRILFLVDPNRRKKGIGFLTNPVFVKEFRTRRLGRSHWMLRLMAACAVGSVLLTYLSATGTIEWGIGAIGGIMVLLQVALILLVAPSLASGLISSELESGGWNLLMLTPMRPTTIVVGKLLSVIWTVSLILVSTLPGYLVLIWIDPKLQSQIFRVITTLVLAGLFTISISAMISSFFRRAAVSTAVAYAVVTLLFAGTTLIWLGRDTTFGYHVVRWALLINPVSAALEAFQTSGFDIYQLIPLNWWITGGASVVCLSIFLIRTSMIMRAR